MPPVFLSKVSSLLKRALTRRFRVWIFPAIAILATGLLAAKLSGSLFVQDLIFKPDPIVVSLDLDRDYSSPENVPYTAKKDVDLYLRGHAEGWRGVADNSQIIVSHDVGGVTLSVSTICFAPKALARGHHDGEDQAIADLRKKADRIEAEYP